MEKSPTYCGEPPSICPLGIGKQQFQDVGLQHDQSPPIPGESLFQDDLSRPTQHQVLVG